MKPAIEQGKTFYLTETADGGFRITPYDPMFPKRRCRSPTD